MHVTISGPNLPRPLCDKGDMHVHAKDCADLRRYPKGADQGGWTIEVDSRRAVVEAVYGDMIAESEWGWEDYVGDLYWAPCTTALPRSPEPTAGPEGFERSAESIAQHAGEVVAEAQSIAERAIRIGQAATMNTGGSVDRNLLTLHRETIDIVERLAAQVEDLARIVHQK